MVNGLIDSHSYLLIHKFMVHTIFGKNDSTKVMLDELFLIWCMSTNRRVNSAYLLFRSMCCAGMKSIDVCRPHYHGLGHTLCTKEARPF